MAECLDFYIQNTAGLMCSNFVNQNAILDTDGALVLGFSSSWGDTKSKRIIIGSNTIQWYQDFIVDGINRDFPSINEWGPLIHLFQVPKWGIADEQNYICIHGPLDNLNANVKIRAGYRAEGSEQITWGDSADFFDTDVAENFICAACACNAFVIGFSRNSSNDLCAGVWDLKSQDPYSVVTESTNNYYQRSAAFTDDDGEAGVVMALGTTYGTDAAYVPFSCADGAFGTPVTLGLASGVTTGRVSEIEIAYDKTNDRIIIFSVFEDRDVGTSPWPLVYELFVSDDGGATFSSIDLDTAGLLGGSEDFSQAKPRLMAGAEGGFLIGYTMKNASGYCRPYVHQVTYSPSGASDILGYSIGEAKECGTAIGPWDENTDMFGPIFFKAPADMQVNIDPIQNLYIGYQIDRTTIVFTTNPQESSSSVGFVLEKLDEQAYPLAADSYYVVESSDDDEIIAQLAILDPPTDHKDYYEEGYTGIFTTNAVKSFSKYGTPIVIEQYEPKNDVYIGGRTAYENPIKYITKCFIDSVAWNTPQQALNQSDFDDYIDRDLRRIYLPPTFFLEYTTNESLSDTVQRTIYLAKFDGFTYEIRQPVPKFINNQITHWEANCYNVGNFDVWSRGGGMT